MPNGRPGDHPYTDITIYNAEIYGPEIDALVREIDSLPGCDEIKHEVSLLLWDNNPWFNKPIGKSYILGKLRLLRLKAEAE